MCEGHTDYGRLTVATKTKAQLAQEALDKEEAMKRLREILEPVRTIYTHVTSVNRTGDQRTIMALVAVKPWEGDRYGGPAQIIDLSWQLSRIGLGKHSDRHGGVTVGGGGMDMGYHLV